VRDLDKIQALNAISTLKNTRADNEQKAAAMRVLAAPKESFKQELEKTTADQDVKEAYIKELDAMFNSWVRDLEIVKRVATEDYRILNTIYIESKDKLKGLPQKKIEVSSSSASATTSQAVSTSSAGFSVPEEPFNMFEHQTENDFLKAYKDARNLWVKRGKEASPNEQRGFYIAINKIKEELDNKIACIENLETRRAISIELKEGWEKLNNDLAKQFKGRNGVNIAELTFIEVLFEDMARTFEMNCGIDKILAKQKTIKKHNTEGFEPAQSSTSSTSSTKLTAIQEVDESQFPPQPSVRAQLEARHSEIIDTIKLKEKFKEVQAKMKEYREKQEKKGKGRE